jgi:hypothetical protein
MFRHLYSLLLCYSCRKKRNAKISPTDLNKNENEEPSQSINSSESNGKKKAKDKNIRDDVSVPLVVVILIIGVYIYLGANIFNYTEQWSLATASYFSFVTFATIGFGDFVPGLKEVNQADSDEVSIGLSTIICAIYVLFGMAILAMCFDLIQESFIKRLYWILKKIQTKNKTKNQDKAKVLAEENKHSDIELKDLSYDNDFASINLTSTNSTFIRSENSLLSANSCYSRSNLRINPHSLDFYKVKSSEFKSKGVKELSQVSC